MRIEPRVLFWLAAAIVFLIAILLLQDILLPFVAGLVIAYALNPLADRLSALGLPRAAASALIVVLVVVTLVVGLTLLLPILAQQIQQLVISLPGELERARVLIEDYARGQLGDRFAAFAAELEKLSQQLANNWSAIAAPIAQSVWSQGLMLVNLVSVFLITPVVVFYILSDWRAMLNKIDSWLPRDEAPTIRRVAGEIDAAIAAFIRGQGLVCIILGVIYAVGLSWAGLKYGLLIGLLTGLFSFVPFVGWMLGLIISLSLGVIQFWPETLPLWTILGVFAVAVSLDASVLGPKIVGPKVGLHPVWLIFSLFVFGYLFGLVGLLVAVPLGAAISVLVRFALEVYLGSGVYHGRNGAIAGADTAAPADTSKASAKPT